MRLKKLQRRDSNSLEEHEELKEFDKEFNAIFSAFDSLIQEVLANIEVLVMLLDNLVVFRSRLQS